MASMTFLINDSSTDSKAPVVRVVITENVNGTVTFAITQLDTAGSYLGDLRGLFFDVADESLIGTLSASSSSTFLTELMQGDDSVKDLGNGANMNGLLGSDGGYDVGVEIGGSGIGADDVRNFSFTLATTQAGGLTLADFSNVSFGARITSVGQDTNGDGTIDTSRSGSSKTGETTFSVITPTNDTALVSEDATATGNVLANDGATAQDALSVVDWSGGALGTAVAPSGLGGATVTLNANGSWSVDANGADSLAAGETRTQTFTYTVLQTNVDGTATLTGQFTVTVNGTNDVPTIGVATLAGTVAEDAVSPMLGSTGAICFDDLDLGDTHTVSATPVDGNTLGGTLAPTVTDTATGAADGTVTWNYRVSNAATQWLAQGQAVTERFTVTLDDGHGGTVSRTVAVTVTGSNDGPTITSVVQRGAVHEAGVNTLVENVALHSAAGTVTFADVDALDVHTVGHTPAAGGYVGTFGLAPLNQATDSVGWRFEVADGALDALQAGQVLTQTYTVTISDGHGGTASQDVTITITGTNDAPTITSATQLGSITEIADNAAGESATLLSAAGAVAFADADALDLHSASFAPASGGYLGTFSLAPLNQGADSVGWSFSVADGTLDALQAGQVLTQTYMVTVDDGHGGTASQGVTITITGTNDVPTLTSANQSGSITEIADNAASENAALLSVAGAVTFADADTLDVHTASFAPAAGGYRHVQPCTVESGDRLSGLELPSQ